MTGPEQDVAQEPEGGERPWERPGAVRRDSLTHRGWLLRALGYISVALGYLALCGGVAGLVGLPLGLAVFALAWCDLARIRKGLIDPDGREPTEQARYLGFIGVLLNFLFLAYHGLLLGSALWNGDSFW